MRIRSHAAMGRFLVREYLRDLPPRYMRAFLIGCVEPDRNPATYFKGSLRSRWMCGHDYANASRFLLRLADRLEGRSHFSLWDYYSLGKLIHYTMDAFTYPHNTHFSEGLPAHRRYEIRLQIYFLAHLHRICIPRVPETLSAAELIQKKHAQYMKLPGRIETDTQYAFSVCCSLVDTLAGNICKCQEFQFHSKEKDDILTE